MILILAFFSTFTYAQQSTQKVIEAFQNSYLHEASGNLAEAILDLKNVYQADSYPINLRLGWLTYSSGMFSESQSYYHKAVILKPYAVEPRMGLVLPLAAMGNWDAVIAQYNKILEIVPNYSIVMHRLGLIYYGQKDYEKAEKYFEKVVNLYPFDYDGLVMLAWTEFQLKKYRQAEVLFNTALMHTPTGASALEGLKLMK
ncbi:MAG: tetratricopeptide repeat protein [Bacteroidales bacterium]|nr:tetratricopeptide repeat protein [Bacteroidales bacterium]